MKYLVFKTQITSQLRCVRMKTSYIQKENCNLLLTVNGYDKLLTMDASTHYVILVKAIQKLMCSDD